MEQKGQVGKKMSRRRKADKRETLSLTLYLTIRCYQNFINIVMYDGKKSKSEKIVYDALDIASLNLKAKTQLII